MPQFIRGLDHIAIIAKSLKESEDFYTQVLGGSVVWKNETNCFIQLGQKDVLALLAAPSGHPFPELQKLHGKKFSHFGFQAESEQEVFEFADHLRKHNVQIIEGPYKRSDGASVYFLDPNGYTLEFFYLRNS